MGSMGMKLLKARTDTLWISVSNHTLAELGILVGFPALIVCVPFMIVRNVLKIMSIHGTIRRHIRRATTLSCFHVKKKNIWPESEKPPVEPPTVRQMLSRPKLKRRKDVDEPRKSGKLSRKGVEMTCSLCREKGHNKKGCSNKNPNENVGGLRGASSSQAASSSYAAASEVLTPDLAEDYIETNTELTSTIRVCCS